MTWPERLGQGRPYEPEERLARFLLGLARADAGDGEAANEAWTGVVEATPSAGFRGGNVTRLDLLGALALERLGRRSTLSDFGNGQEGAMARLVQIVRSGARTDTSVAYALWNLEERGRMFIGPQAPVYTGMIIGEHSRDNDLEVNPLKGKKLTNVRASGTDEAVRLTTPVTLSLEEAIAYINDDELVEVTPNSVRLRKRYLDPHERKRAQRRAEAETG